MTEMTDYESLMANRFAALATRDSGDWSDVRRRAGMGRTRVWWALPVAAALTAILVGSAFALYRDSIAFWSAPSAPERIVVDFRKMRALAIPGLGLNVISG